MPDTHVPSPDLAAAILNLLRKRAVDATVCPSEIARQTAGVGEWRALMTPVHAAVDGLVDAGRVRLSWKGAHLSRRNGPYRIGRGPRFDPQG